jgi:CubicO group peptidase (beta-lactamase class C family)
MQGLFASWGGWCLRGSPWLDSLVRNGDEKMKAIFQRGILILSVGLILACSEAKPDASVSRSFSALSPPETHALIDERAHAHNVRAASITFINGSGGMNHGVGGADAQSLFQAASLSKAVAAAGILTLMEREGIDIDTDIRDHFTSIDIRALSGGDQPLTVRELLSHTAGATQGGYPGYHRDSILPTSAEIILAPPHRFVSPVTLSGEKGTFDYSGGGYQIAQLLAEDVSGQPFAELMHDILLTPLGMTHSTFAQPIAPSTIAPLRIIGADSGIRIREGLFRPLNDSWHNYPEQAAAGLWTTSSDYARFVLAVINAAEGRTSSLSTTVGKAMLTPIGYPAWAGEQERYGLGVVIEPGPQGEIMSVWHSGLNAGYRSFFRAEPQSGRIVVSLSNSPGGAAFNEEIVDGLFLMSRKE